MSLPPMILNLSSVVVLPHQSMRYSKSIRPETAGLTINMTQSYGTRSKGRRWTPQIANAVKRSARRTRTHRAPCLFQHVQYYEAVGNLPPRNGGPRWRSPTTSPRKGCAHLRSNGEIDSDEDGDPPTKSTHTTDQQRHDEGIQQHRKAIGRHRHDWEPASTPPDYW